LDEHIKDQGSADAHSEVLSSANGEPAQDASVSEPKAGGVVGHTATERPEDPQVSNSQEGPKQGDAGREVPSQPIAAPCPPSPKKTSAETLSELVKAIRSMHADFSIAMEGVRASHALIQRVDKERQFVDRAALDALARIHGLTFKHLQAHSDDAGDPNSFANTLLQLVEGEFKYLGVEIVRPARDEQVDYGTMEAIGSVPCGLLQKSGRVAEVERCGFLLRTQDGIRILHKAKVVVRTRGARKESVE
jgi:hypothetical protein